MNVFKLFHLNGKLAFVGYDYRVAARLGVSVEMIEECASMGRNIRSKNKECTFLGIKYIVAYCEDTRLC